MIDTNHLSTLQDFQSLKKGDIVAVEWRRDVQKTKRTRTRFGVYNIAENKSGTTEIILQKPLNIYFNYMMFLEPKEHGLSNACSVVLISSNQN